MSIKHSRLGKHGVLVSNLCLGTMNFGWHTSEEDSFAIMDRALELGINFFDTADVYGWSVEHGLTEEIIGRWLAQGGGRRDAVVLATKVYNPVDRKANLPEVNSDGTSLSAYKIRKHCEGSLKRLQTDRIDLYQMHHIDRDCPWDETWQSFDTLVKQGKVVYVGSSNFAGWDIATACQEASKRGLMGLASEQSIYHLDNRMIEMEDNVGADKYPLRGHSRLPSLRPGADPLEPPGRGPAWRRTRKIGNRPAYGRRICQKGRGKTTAVGTLRSPLRTTRPPAR